VKAVKKIKGQGNQDGNKDEQKFCVHLIALLRRVGFGFKLGAFRHACFPARWRHLRVAQLRFPRGSE
jgi:hypothetical protein